MVEMVEEQICQVCAKVCAIPMEMIRQESQLIFVKQHNGRHCCRREVGSVWGERGRQPGCGPCGRSCSWRDCSQKYVVSQLTCVSMRVCVCGACMCVCVVD